MPVVTIPVWLAISIAFICFVIGWTFGIHSALKRLAARLVEINLLWGKDWQRLTVALVDMVNHFGGEFGQVVGDEGRRVLSQAVGALEATAPRHEEPPIPDDPSRSQAKLSYRHPSGVTMEIVQATPEQIKMLNELLARARAEGQSPPTT